MIPQRRPPLALYANEDANHGPSAVLAPEDARVIGVALLRAAFDERAVRVVLDVDEPHMRPVD